MVGAESSGKSFLVNGLLQREFNFSDARIATRRPLKLSLIVTIEGLEEGMNEKFEYAPDFRKPTEYISVTLEDLRRFIAEENKPGKVYGLEEREPTLSNNAGVFRPRPEDTVTGHPIYVRITRRCGDGALGNNSNLAITDLPGLRIQDGDLRIGIERLVGTHIGAPHVFVVSVDPATATAATSLALGALSRAAEAHQRSVSTIWVHHQKGGGDLCSTWMAKQRSPVLTLHDARSKCATEWDDDATNYSRDVNRVRIEQHVLTGWIREPGGKIEDDIDSAGELLKVVREAQVYAACMSGNVVELARFLEQAGTVPHVDLAAANDLAANEETRAVLAQQQQPPANRGLGRGQALAREMGTFATTYRADMERLSGRLGIGNLASYMESKLFKLTLEKILGADVGAMLTDVVAERRRLAAMEKNINGAMLSEHTSALERTYREILGGLRYDEAVAADYGLDYAGDVQLASMLSALLEGSPESDHVSPAPHEYMSADDMFHEMVFSLALASSGGPNPQPVSSLSDLLALSDDQIKQICTAPFAGAKAAKPERALQRLLDRVCQLRAEGAPSPAIPAGDIPASSARIYGGASFRRMVMGISGSIVMSMTLSPSEILANLPLATGAHLREIVKSLLRHLSVRKFAERGAVPQLESLSRETKKLGIYLAHVVSIAYSTLKVTHPASHTFFETFPAFRARVKMAVRRHILDLATSQKLDQVIMDSLSGAADNIVASSVRDKFGDDMRDPNSIIIPTRSDLKQRLPGQTQKLVLEMKFVGDEIVKGTSIREMTRAVLEEGHEDRGKAIRWIVDNVDIYLMVVRLQIPGLVNTLLDAELLRKLFVGLPVFFAAAQKNLSPTDERYRKDFDIVELQRKRDHLQHCYDVIRKFREKAARIVSKVHSLNEAGVLDGSRLL